MNVGRVLLISACPCGHSHVREPLYFNIAVWLQSWRARTTHFWVSVIHSKSTFFATIFIHDDFFSFGIITKVL